VCLGAGPSGLASMHQAIGAEIDAESDGSILGFAFSRYGAKPDCDCCWFQVRPRALGERTAPHRGAGDAWRAHQPFQRVRVLCREVKGFQSLDLCIARAGAWGRWNAGRVAEDQRRQVPAFIRLDFASCINVALPAPFGKGLAHPLEFALDGGNLHQSRCCKHIPCASTGSAAAMT
jgi:hypothetical protein